MNNISITFHLRRRVIGFAVALALVASALAYPLLTSENGSVNIDSAKDVPAYAGPVVGPGGGGGGG